MSVVFYALNIWLPLFAGSHIIYGNNTGVIPGLKHFSIIRPAMELLRKIAMILATHNVVIKSN